MSKTTEKQIAQLENEIQSSLEALKEASFIAATGSKSPADRLKKARSILEQKELLRLTRLELAESRKRLRSETEASAKAARIKSREHICAIVDEIDSYYASMETSLKTAGAQYAKIKEATAEILLLGRDAQDFDLSTFKSTQPMKSVYTNAVFSVAKHFGFEPKDYLESWPSDRKIDEGIERSLQSIRGARDTWRNPPELDPEGLIEFVEVSPEGKELENA